MSAPALAKTAVFGGPVLTIDNCNYHGKARKGPGRALVSASPPRLVPKIDVTGLDAALEELDREQNRSENTRRSYRSDVRNFEAFCRTIERQEFPARPETVALYLMHLAKAGKAMATLAHRLAAIAAEHVDAGQPTPCNAHVAKVLAQIQCKFGSARKPKTPIFKADLERMLLHTADDVRGLRDRAILLAGVGSACRRSELAALDLADVTIQSPQGFILRLRRSKTDQIGAGRDVPVRSGEHEETCPLRALERWLVARGSWEGPLFCRVALHTGKAIRQRLAPAAIAAAVKAAAKRAGMDESKYAGHSMRRGYASMGFAESGGSAANLIAIKKQLGHATTAMTELYIAEESPFAGSHPLKGVL